MNVQSSQSWESEDGSWRKVSVGLNWLDLVKLAAEKRIEGYHLAVDADGDQIDGEVHIVSDAGQEMPLVEQYKVLQAQADILVWFQRAIEGYPAERVKAEIAAIRKRVPALK